MSRRIIPAIGLCVMGLWFAFGVPAYLVREPEWYFQLPSVLPPDKLDEAARLVGGILIGLAILIIVPPPIRKSKDTRSGNSDHVQYSHTDYLPGTVVTITQRATYLGPNANLAGMALLATLGRRARTDLLPVTQLVPVQTPYGTVEYVNANNVRRWVDDGSSVGTLPGRKHGYGCRCYSCVSQLL